jgi:hypothetical protein
MPVRSLSAEAFPLHPYFALAAAEMRIKAGA